MPSSSKKYNIASLVFHLLLTASCSLGRCQNQNTVVRKLGSCQQGKIPIWELDQGPKCLQKSSIFTWEAGTLQSHSWQLLLLSLFGTVTKRAIHSVPIHCLGLNNTKKKPKNNHGLIETFKRSPDDMLVMTRKYHQEPVLGSVGSLFVFSMNS